MEKGNAAAKKIKDGYKDAKVKVMEVDLARLESVRFFADNFAKNYSQLDLLINNAGVMVPPYSKTADGFELQLGTNHLGHFALTGLLIDLLIKTQGSRVVNVSSNAHKIGKLDFGDLNWEKRKYKKWKSYGDSKISNLYFTYQLQQRLDDVKADVFAATSHPGWTATELQRHTGLMSALNNFFAQGIDMGALPTLYAAVGPDVKSGDYFGPSGFLEMKGYPKKAESNPLSKDKKIAEKLWDVSEKMTGVRFLSK